MAILGRIIKEKNERINIRLGEVVGDIIMDHEYLQLRTYSMGDQNRERGSKQNIQFTKQKARDFRDILDSFLK